MRRGNLDTETEMHKGTKWPCENWSDDTTTKDTQDAGERPEQTLPSAPGGGTQPCCHLELRLLASRTPETTHFCSPQALSLRYLVTAVPGNIPTQKSQASVPHFGLLRPGAERGGVGSPQPAPSSLILQFKSHSNLLSQPCPRAHRQLPSAHECAQGPDPARRSPGPPGGHGAIWQGILGSRVPECGLEGPCRFTCFLMRQMGST